MAEDGASQVSDTVSKVLTAFDGVSGYTPFAIAAAGALTIWLPSPIHGIDLAPIRTGIYGAGVVAVTVLASFLWLAKAARVAHDIAITAWHRRDERLGRRLVLLPRMEIHSGAQQETHRAFRST
jgi:hypothetical protein